MADNPYAQIAFQIANQNNPEYAALNYAASVQHTPDIELNNLKLGALLDKAKEDRGLAAKNALLDKQHRQALGRIAAQNKAQQDNHLRNLLEDYNERLTSRGFAPQKSYDDALLAWSRLNNSMAQGMGALQDPNAGTMAGQPTFTGRERQQYVGSGTRMSNNQPIPVNFSGMSGGVGGTGNINDQYLQNIKINSALQDYVNAGNSTGYTDLVNDMLQQQKKTQEEFKAPREYLPYQEFGPLIGSHNVQNLQKDNPLIKKSADESNGDYAQRVRDFQNYMNQNKLTKLDKNSAQYNDMINRGLPQIIIDLQSQYPGDWDRTSFDLFTDDYGQVHIVNPSADVDVIANPNNRMGISVAGQ